MLAALLAQVTDWVAPTIDWHAIAPELVLVAGINIVLLIDLNISESKKWIMATLTGFVMLAALIPVVTLFVIGDDSRSMFGGRYVIDEYALIMKALFLLVAYVVILMSQTELEEGGYYQGEFYVLMMCSVLGMVMMTSSRDLISIFVALELLSIPAYMMAAWNKRSSKSNEAGVKYYLLGVFASAVMLYGMSLLFGSTNSTLLSEIGASLSDGNLNGIEVVGVIFIISGFAFKISAVPFHSSGYGLPIGGIQGGWLRCPGDDCLPRPAERGRCLPAVHLGACGADDDGGQRARSASDQHCSHARLLFSQPGWFHPDAVGVCG